MRTLTPPPPIHAPPAEWFGADRRRLGPYSCWPFVDRRSGRDRRAGGTKLLSRFSWLGQRVAGRRQGELSSHYVDRYLPGDVALAVGILALNILDAWFTLVYLDKGGSEANPVAQFLLDQGWFIFSKAVIVGLCVLFLTIHKTFPLVRPALVFLLVFYSLLFAYHLYLFLSFDGVAVAP